MIIHQRNVEPTEYDGWTLCAYGSIWIHSSQFVCWMQIFEYWNNFTFVCFWCAHLEVIAFSSFGSNSLRMWLRQIRIILWHFWRIEPIPSSVVFWDEMRVLKIWGWECVYVFLAHEIFWRKQLFWNNRPRDAFNSSEVSIFKICHRFEWEHLLNERCFF